MFKGKVIVITGSSAGIGAGAAVKFATEGAKGIVLHGRNEKALKEVKEKCDKVGQGDVKVSVCVGDITDDNVRKALIDMAISEFGQLDVLVNNAGIHKRGDTSIEVYDDIFNVNVRSVIVMCQLAVPHLLKTKGNIVNISSVTGLKANTIAPYYCCSKAALDHYTKCLALELGLKGIRVNSVNPGYVTGTKILTRNGFTKADVEKIVDGLVQVYPLRRLGTIEEIAQVIAFIASDQATFITGAMLPVDGGYSKA